MALGGVADTALAQPKVPPCPALVSLIRGSNASRARSLRREDLRHAATEIRYTLRYMKPDCPIYGEVQAAKIRAESLQKIVQ